MINPELINKPDRVFIDGEMSILDIKQMQYFDKEEYDLNNEKEYKRYISDLEKLVRGSIHYRLLVSYLRNSEGMDKCAFLDNASTENGNKIEIHHTPFTLFDITNTVVNKRIKNNEPMDIELVAEEILYLHYCGYVGLIPLCETVHQMVHNSFIFIPTDVVRFSYQQFINAYYNYIDPMLLDYIDAAERLTKEGDLVKKQMELFNQHKIYVNVDGSYALPGLTEIQNCIKFRINELKNKRINMCDIVK